MKLKKSVRVLLITAMVVSASVPTFASVQAQPSVRSVEECSTSFNPNEIGLQYSAKQARGKQVWIWTKYPDAWKIEFFNDDGVGKCKVFPKKGDMNYFIVTCDSTVDGKCFVEE